MAEDSARAALLAHVAFVEATLDSLVEGIVACDAEGTLVLFNEATRRFHGLPEEELPPERWADHYDLYDETGTRPLAVHEIPLFRALAGEEVRDVGMVIAPRTGVAPRRLLASGRQVRDDSGTLLGAVVAMRDVTDQLAAEEDARARRERADRLRADLVAGLSHDMRSPLAAIVGFTELLDDRSGAVLGGGLLPDVIDVLRRQAAHLDLLIGQLVEHDRVGSDDSLPLVVCTTSLTDLAAESVETYGYTKRVALLDGPPVEVVCDPTRVHRVLDNLVGNALRHTVGPVTVRVARMGSDGIVEVRDRGGGLGDDPEAWFGRAVRGRHSPGQGLGLYLARRIVEEHGGTLTAADAPGGGAVFTAKLPLAGPAPSRTEPGSDPHEGSRHAAATVPAGPHAERPSTDEVRPSRPHPRELSPLGPSPGIEQ